MVKGAKDVILFDPRNNHQLYETNLQRAQFEVTKNHDSYELVRRGLLERNCFKIKFSTKTLMKTSSIQNNLKCNKYLFASEYLESRLWKISIIQWSSTSSMSNWTWRVPFYSVVLVAWSSKLSRKRRGNQYSCDLFVYRIVWKGNPLSNLPTWV